MREQSKKKDIAEVASNNGDCDEKRRHLLKKIAITGVGVPVALKMITVKANAGPTMS
jgi:hypothetical protein